MDGNKAIAPPTKSEQNRSRCNCLLARWRNRQNNYRAGRDVQYAILSGATVFVIASEAITYAGKNSVGGHGLDIT